MKRFFVWLAVLTVMLTETAAYAGQQLEAVYPYSLEKREISSVTGQSILPLYINLTSFDVPRMQQAEVSVRLPEGFSALAKEGWRIRAGGAFAYWDLDADYCQNFDLLYLKADEDTASGSKEITVSVTGDGWEETKIITFSYDAAGKMQEQVQAINKTVDKKKFNW